MSKYRIKQIQIQRDNRGNICEWMGCTETKELQFAHRHGFEWRNGRGRGSDVRLNYIKNQPVSLMLLCESHHYQYDHPKRQN